jgi:hypothetical protein
MSTTGSTDVKTLEMRAFDLRKAGHTFQQVGVLLSTPKHQVSADEAEALVYGYMRRTREENRLKLEEEADFNLFSTIDLDWHKKSASCTLRHPPDFKNPVFKVRAKRSDKEATEKSDSELLDLVAAVRAHNYKYHP